MFNGQLQACIFLSLMLFKPGQDHWKNENNLKIEDYLKNKDHLKNSD